MGLAQIWGWGCTQEVPWRGPTLQTQRLDVWSILPFKFSKTGAPDTALRCLEQPPLSLRIETHRDARRRIEMADRPTVSVKPCEPFSAFVCVLFVY